jgi:ATP-dependent protease ClpP protease subunit
VIGKINIHGQIGPSYVDEQGLFHKGVVLLDVVEQAESNPKATEFEVSINSPGGYVDIGDAIYNYLQSLKSKGKVTTIQEGIVGSIATKIFLAGDERLADDRFQFWIHNPYKENVSGDSDQLMEMAKGLAEAETQLRQFYMNFTKINEHALDSLMKIETGLNADQCVKFGFATAKKPVQVLNIIKPTMKEEKSFMEHVKAFFTQAQVPPTESAVEGEPKPEEKEEEKAAEEMIPKSEVDALIAAAVQKALEEKAMEPGELEEEEMVAKSQVEPMIKAAVEAALAEVNAKNEAAILALKKTAKIGVQPTKA